MTRLTNSLKDSIAANAVRKAGFLEKEAALVAKRAEWAERVRVEALGGKEALRKISLIEKYLEKHGGPIRPTVLQVDQLFDTNPGIQLSMAGLRYFAHFSGLQKPERWGGAVIKISPYSFTLDAGHPLAEEFAALEADQADLGNGKSELLAKVRGSLSSVTTVKKLLEAWPECAELLPKAEAQTKAIAIRSDELNALIGLPSGEP